MSRLATAILLLAVLVAGVWFERAPLLRGAADLWIVSDPVTRSDVVAVLGGQVEVRPFFAGVHSRRMVEDRGRHDHLPE